MKRAFAPLAIALAWTSVNLAPAILAEGGPAAFFTHPALTAMTIATLPMAVAATASQGNFSTGEKEDRGNRWVFSAFLLLGIPVIVLPAYTDRIGFWTLDGDTVRWLGVLLYVAGGALRIWPVFTLGRRFSGLVAIQRSHALVTTGLYATIRNPSYLGLMINLVGWVLAFRSGVGLLLAALFLLPLHARIRSEERMLQAHFGATYDAYRARTWRLIPGLY